MTLQITPFLTLVLLTSVLTASAKPITSDNADKVCEWAGLGAVSRSESIQWFFGKSYDQPTRYGASGRFKTKAKFYNSTSGKWDEKEVLGYADYENHLILERGRTAVIEYQGGIANLQHSKGGFKLFLGFKIGDKDEWKEMKLLDGPGTTYTRFQLTLDKVDFPTGPIRVWFEGRYQERGEQKVYDSDNGNDYRAVVVEKNSSSLCFTDHFDQAVKGDIRAGGDIEVIYNTDRVRSKLSGTSYNGYPSWGVHGFYLVRDRGGKILAQGKYPVIAYATNPENGSSAYERPSFAGRIHVPAEASGGKLEVWFQGYARGPSVWDSDFNSNYVLAIP